MTIEKDTTIRYGASFLLDGLACTMTNTLRNLTLFSFIVLCSSAARSHDHIENKFYIGMKAGALFAENPKADSTNPIGLQLEYNINQNLAIEVDYIKGSTDRDNSASNVNIEYLGTYGVLRSKNTTYALVKVGFVNNLATASELNQESTSLSAGVGAGVVINRNFSLESEYTLINEDLKYFGLSFRYGF